MAEATQQDMPFWGRAKLYLANQHKTKVVRIHHQSSTGWPADHSNPDPRSVGIPAIFVSPPVTSYLNDAYRPDNRLVCSPRRLPPSSPKSTPSSSQTQMERLLLFPGSSSIRSTRPLSVMMFQISHRSRLAPNFSSPSHPVRQPRRFALLHFPRDARQAMVEPIHVNGHARDCHRA